MLTSLKTIQPSYQRLLDAYYSRRSENTRRVYEAGLRAYALWLGTSPVQAAAYLVQSGRQEASTSTLEFLDALAAKGLSSSTISARLTALKALLQVARISGLCDYSLEVDPPPSTHWRETRGPGRENVQALIRAAACQSPKEKAVRDVAILRLLYDLALRCGEVASLRRQDFDGRRIWVKGKGSLDREALTLPEGTAMSISSWLMWRGDHAGPLFQRMDRALVSELPGLSPRAIRAMVSDLSAGLGFHAWPHGLRHSAITDALDAGFDLRTVHRFGRWRGGLDIVISYDDNRRELGASVAAALSRGIH